MSRKHKQGLPRALYTRVKPMVEGNEMLDCMKAAVQAGIKEVHLGWTRCAFCGVELGQAVESEFLNDAGSGSSMLQIHLCDRCWYKYKGASKKN